MKTSPKTLQANGLWNIFSGKKKYIVTCGNCEHTYSDKVYFKSNDTASSICPCCNTQNTWSHSEWSKRYDSELESQLK